MWSAVQGDRRVRTILMPVDQYIGTLLITARVAKRAKVMFLQVSVIL